MDEFTKLIVKSILARDALHEHECKEHPKWCPHYDIGCDEAKLLFAADGEAWEKASEAIAKHGADIQ